MHLIFVLKLQLLIFSSPRAAKRQKLSPQCHRGVMIPEPQHGRVPLGWGWRESAHVWRQNICFSPCYPRKEPFKPHLKMK